MKIKTNRQAIKKLIEDCSDIELALLRERILMVKDMTLKSIEDNFDTWDRSIVHPSLYIALCNKITDNLNFDEQ